MMLRLGGLGRRLAFTGLLLAVSAYSSFALAEDPEPAQPAVKLSDKSWPAKTMGKKPPAKPAAKPGSGKKKPPTLVKGTTIEPLQPFVLAKYQYCGSDQDCVLAQNGCCDCANGGQDVAINKERVAAFQARFDCLNVSCGELEGDPACGSGVISCVNHKCRYFANAPSAPKPTPTPKKKKKEEEEDEE